MFYTLITGQAKDVKRIKQSRLLLPSEAGFFRAVAVVWSSPPLFKKVIWMKANVKNVGRKLMSLCTTQRQGDFVSTTFFPIYSGD